MTDLTRLISRLDDLTRQLADLEAEHKALREDHRLLKMKVEEMEGEGEPTEEWLEDGTIVYPQRGGT